MPAILRPDDLASLIDQLTHAGYDVRKDGARKGINTLLDERYFRRLDKFTGEEGKWQEWFFNLMVTLGNLDIKLVNAFEAFIRETTGPWTPGSLTETMLPSDVKDKFASELFGLLCNLTSGEANIVVRSILDKGAGYCGFAAMHVLNVRFNPKTPTRILQFLSVVVQPPPVKDIRFLAKAVEDWEAKKMKLKSEFKE
jgi:hypothetical protein